MDAHPTLAGQADKSLLLALLTPAVVAMDQM